MKEKNGEHPFGDAGQLILAALFLLVWAADSFFLRKSTFLSLYIPLYLRLAFLIIALCTSFYLARSGHAVAGDRPKSDGVVVAGAFRYVRHPLYLACLLTYLALAVSTFSLCSFVFVAAAFVFYNFIADYEERLLEEKFGNVYRDYRNKTGRWLPRINRP